MSSSEMRSFRRHIEALLSSRQAHGGFEAAVAGLPSRLRGVRPPGCPHTPWQILEHLRLCQWDILEFSRDAAHISPSFPEGYWPHTEAPPTDQSWDESLNQFRSDLQAMQRLVADPSVDLLAPIPHGQGQTVLREALLLADHNAYHIGQLILVRRLLNAWP